MLKILMLNFQSSKKKNKKNIKIINVVISKTLKIYYLKT